MNKLQKTIEEMKVHVSKAKTIRDRNIPDGMTYCACHAVVLALETYIPKLTLLLNEQPEAITEDSHFCKHDVRRSAADSETNNIGNIASESSSETAIVRQNEQTKEDFYKMKYEKCIMVIKRFDAGIIGLYDL